MKRLTFLLLILSSTLGSIGCPQNKKAPAEDNMTKMIGIYQSDEIPVGDVYGVKSFTYKLCINYFDKRYNPNGSYLVELVETANFKSKTVGVGLQIFADVEPKTISFTRHEWTSNHEVLLTSPLASNPYKMLIDVEPSNVSAIMVKLEINGTPTKTSQRLQLPVVFKKVYNGN